MVFIWWWKYFVFVGAMTTAAACRKTYTYKYKSKNCIYFAHNKTFDCADVTLKTLETSHLQSHSREIKHLLLGNTQLRKLEANVFSFVPELLSLNMSNNDLKVLEFPVFRNLTQLQIIDLTNNKLKSLHDELLFESQGNLLTLLLQKNKLTTLDFAVLNPLRSITVLVLTGNPFVCNCQLILTMNWCREKGLDTKAVCELPRTYSGKSWSVLNTSELCQVTQMENEANQTEYASTTERISEDPTTAKWNGGTSVKMITIYTCVTIIVLCAGGTSFYCWRKCRQEGTCKTIQSKNNLIDSSNTDYYTNIDPHFQNVNRISSPPVLPRRPLVSGTRSKGQLQRSNGKELYSYAEYNVAQHNNLTSSGQSSNISESPPKNNILSATEQDVAYSLYSNGLYIQT
jgi:hypothetical protein